MTLDATPPAVPPDDAPTTAADLHAATSDADLCDVLSDGLARTLARRRVDHVSGLVHGGVSTAQLWVLMKLRYHGDLSISGLAELLGLGLPNVTGLVDRLEERGLVERHRDPDDRRVVHVTLTPAGCRIPDEMEGLQRDVLGRVVRAMDRETLERCLAVVGDVEMEAGPVPVDRRCATPTVRAEKG